MALCFVVSSMHAQQSVVVSDPVSSIHFPPSFPISAELVSEIRSRRKEIRDHRESYRLLTQLSPIQREVSQLLEEGTLEPLSIGTGGLYVLRDRNRQPRFMIKPADESLRCIHNPKGSATPFHDLAHRLRSSIPLYASAEREACAFAFAKKFGFTSVTPETELVILSSSMFHDFTKGASEGTQDAWYQVAGYPDLDKLCSAQRFLSDAIDIRTAMHEWFEAGYETKNIPLPIDPDIFSLLHLFLWLVYDNDGHSSNTLLRCAYLDPADGHPVYRVMKIDNGLCFPEENCQFFNYLGSLSNAMYPLTPRATALLASISLGEVCALLKVFGLEKSMNAFAERLVLLQELVWRNLTIREINLRMEALGASHTRHLVLSPLSYEDIESQLGTGPSAGPDA